MDTVPLISQALAAPVELKLKHLWSAKTLSELVGHVREPFANGSNIDSCGRAEYLRTTPMRSPSFLHELACIKTQALADRERNKQDYMEALGLMQQCASGLRALAEKLGIKVKALEDAPPPAPPLQ
jgi:hypothetical protein